MITKLGRTSRRSPTLSANYDWKEIESRVRTFYAKTDTREMLGRKLSRKPLVGYVEGPPTLNAEPHAGHIRGRVYKDLWYRNASMEGKNVVFRGGWDTQGLPVELQAEKEMGLTGSKRENLDKVGVEALVAACKAMVAKVRSLWAEADLLLGLSLDQEAAYMTYRDSYIEREWKYLEIAWKNGLLGEGYKVVAYCPSCQTALSHAEVALGGYEQLEDPSLYYKVRASDGSFLVIWTTMPFTVVTDELVAVKPDAVYEYVKVGDETWVVGAERKEALASELGIQMGAVVKKVKGKDLAGLRYAHPLVDEIPGLKSISSEVHGVVAEDFVDTSTGTGLVHLSPANGEDDFAVAQSMGVPIFAPLDDQVRFTQEAGSFAGIFARDADEKVVEDLKAAGSLIHAGKTTHDYPVCWRSGHRIVWLARREYFYWVDRIRRKLLRAASKVEYFFDAPRNRFLEFIKESPPWGITRERVWGTPLPVWVCRDCGEKTGAFSRKRIVELAASLPDGPDFELHRPWVDRVVLKCPKCGGRAHREPFVLDTWHNSGSAPYAAFTDREYGRLVPTEFQTEAIDQTRGWAYTLLVLNVIRTGRPVAPYRSFLLQGFVLDDRGRKMSKSLGNVVTGLDLLRGSAVDVTRFYLTWKSSPEDLLDLDLEEMKTRPYQVMNTVYHLHVYLSQNGAVDGYIPVRHTVAWAAKRRLLTAVDWWVLAKLSSARKKVRNAHRTGRYNDLCRALEKLVITEISQTYVRLVRGELWKEEASERTRRLAIYAVLGHVLRAVDELLHPVSPYATEYLYQEVFEEGRWKRPLLVAGYSRPPEGRPRPDAEASVDFGLKVEEACNSARMKARLKRRWPLRSLRVLVPSRDRRVARSAVQIVKTLCNVKEVELSTSAKDFPATFQLRSNPTRIGALFKQRTAEVLRGASRLEGTEALRAHSSGRPVKVSTASGEVRVPLEAFELSTAPTEGTEVGESGGVFVSISRQRDDQLVAEGLVRDLARRLQALRKKKGFVPTAVLPYAAVAGLDKDEISQLERMKKELTFLVRVKKVTMRLKPDKAHRWTREDLDGRPLFLDVG